MQTVTAHQEKEQVDWGASAWEAIRLDLTETKMALYEEISSYPAPVAGCDQQFNYLLERRTGIQKEMVRLNRYVEESGTSDKAVEEFVASSVYINGDTKELLLRRLLQ